MDSISSIELRRTSRSLARAIFEAEVPEQFIRTIPAQSLYLAVKETGIHSSGDIIEIATVEQTRLMIDFDIWQRDKFSEDNFWHWLSLTDDGGDLKLLQKVLKCVDLKLIALLISKYVHTVTFDEPTENPPGAGYYTPDKGNTWLHINIPDSDRHFQMGRLLALVFETSAELFYQLISIQSVATESGLEEEAFQEKNKRLLAEGVPDLELAYQINSPLSTESARLELRKSNIHQLTSDISVIEPLIYDGLNIEPLSSLVKSGKEGLEEEITLVINAAIVRFGIDFSEQEILANFILKVRGTINVGLETALQLEPALDSGSIYQSLGIKGIYRLGLSKLKEPRTLAEKITKKHSDAAQIRPEHFSILAGAREAFPQVPNFLKPDGSIESHSGVLAAGYRPVESLADISLLISQLNQIS